MRSAQSACRALPSQVRGMGRSMRASCIVMVEPPATMRRAARLSRAARTAARRSTPRWSKKRRSSAAMKAWISSGSISASGSQPPRLPSGARVVRSTRP